MDKKDRFKIFFSRIRRELISSNNEEELFHNTKQLLELYPIVRWRLENKLDDLNAICLEFYNEPLAEAIDALLGINPSMDRMNLKDNLQDMEFSWYILKLVNRALDLLKDYPENGEKYFNLLKMMYIDKKRCTENEILELLNIGRTTLYKDKKKAIRMFGAVLWGFIIPDIT